MKIKHYSYTTLFYSAHLHTAQHIEQPPPFGYPTTPCVTLNLEHPPSVTCHSTKLLVWPLISRFVFSLSVSSITTPVFHQQISIAPLVPCLHLRSCLYSHWLLPWPHPHYGVLIKGSLGPSTLAMLSWSFITFIISCDLPWSSLGLPSTMIMSSRIPFATSCSCNMFPHIHTPWPTLDWVEKTIITLWTCWHSGHKCSCGIQCT